MVSIMDKVGKINKDFLEVRLKHLDKQCENAKNVWRCDTPEKCCDCDVTITRRVLSRLEVIE